MLPTQCVLGLGILLALKRRIDSCRIFLVTSVLWVDKLKRAMMRVSESLEEGIMDPWDDCWSLRYGFDDEYDPPVFDDEESS